MDVKCRALQKILQNFKKLLDMIVKTKVLCRDYIRVLLIEHASSYIHLSQ